jgi:hypothetical protein
VKRKKRLAGAKNCRFRSWQLENLKGLLILKKEIALQILTRKLLQILSGPTQSSLSIISLQGYYTTIRGLN